MFEVSIYDEECEKEKNFYGLRTSRLGVWLAIFNFCCVSWQVFKWQKWIRICPRELAVTYNYAQVISYATLSNSSVIYSYIAFLQTLMLLNSPESSFWNKEYVV